MDGWMNNQSIKQSIAAQSINIMIGAACTNTITLVNTI